MTNMQLADDNPGAEITLRYQMVDGVLQIDIESNGLQDDPNLIAMHLALALDRMTAVVVQK